MLHGTQEEDTSDFGYTHLLAGLALHVGFVNREKNIKSHQTFPLQSDSGDLRNEKHLNMSPSLFSLFSLSQGVDPAEIRLSSTVM